MSRRSLRWLLLLGLAGPAHAQAPATPANPNAAALSAFAQAYIVCKQDFLQTLSGKALMLRALHGVAADQRFTDKQPQEIVATAIAKAESVEPTDDHALLMTFGTTLESLHRLAAAPSVETILRIAVAGMVDGLDAETRLLPPEQPTAPADAGSAGLALAAGPDGPRVIQAYAGAPAARAGLQRDDAVLAIDGHATKGLPLERVMTLLRGPVGSTTTLAVRRGTATAPISITLTRAIVRIASVSGHDFGPVAYLRIETFAPGAATELQRLFTELRSHAATPLQGVVLDLRDNPGGRLDEAIATAGELLPPATLIASTKARQPAGQQRFTATQGDMTSGLPMVVLINDGTGAGSEVVAAALQAGRGAVLMGGHTAGAGLVATILPLPPLGTLRLTTQRLILASGDPLGPPGLLPQIALMPSRSRTPGATPAEARSSDPMILRLRRGIPQTPQPGEPFETPGAPERDFTVQDAVAAITLMAQAH